MPCLATSIESACRVPLQSCLLVWEILDRSFQDLTMRTFADGLLPDTYGFRWIGQTGRDVDLWNLLGSELESRGAIVSVSWVQGHAENIDVQRGRAIQSKNGPMMVPTTLL